MNYEGWRITFQSSEEAARSAYNDAFKQWNRAQSLEAQLFECQSKLAEYKRLFEEAQKQEPYLWVNPDPSYYYIEDWYSEKAEPGWEPLYRAHIPAQPAQAGTVVPDGWQFVPIKPTEAMLDAADRCLMTPLSGMSRGSGPSRVFAAMLAAAPKPEGETK